ncbi:uncharacterized protein TM35_001501030 [Trypanosoma theileri]|uniref:Mucin-associated surface protein (MASP) n=1 Tax=Trypanosoma theileri TaxID=67003 RepID=A0A1X0NE21_9TRYP|nr:uncharacterized protein TM35_001501030 [Trypanosoma theileri]ORC80673.1 hypothetical protein TM35_001501030 [Trypanosoma theileri]
MAMKKMMGHLLCLLALILYCFCGCVMASHHNINPGAPGVPGGAAFAGGVAGGPNPLDPQHGGWPPVAGVGKPPFIPPGPHQMRQPSSVIPNGACPNPGVPCPGGVPGGVGPVSVPGMVGNPGANVLFNTFNAPLPPPHNPGPAVKPAVPGPAGPAFSHASNDMSLSTQLNGGISQPGVVVGQRDMRPAANTIENRPNVPNSLTKAHNGVLEGNMMDGKENVMERKTSVTLEGPNIVNASKPETLQSPVSPVKGVSGNQPSEGNTQKKETDSSDSEHKGESGVIGAKGNQEPIKETTHGPQQQDNHNTEPNATGTTSTDSHVTADSKPHPTRDSQQQSAERTQSGLSTDDSNTPNNTSTEPKSTTDNVSTAENESTNGVDTAVASAEGNTTANTTSVTLNTNSHEESISTSPTTTNTIPTIPGISNNNIMPNVKGDADSSSSISSSVWVRVPLLIVVTLACILVC